MNRRDLAVEIVDAIHDYTVEHSASPEVHEGQYDQVEQLLLRGQALFEPTTWPECSECSVPYVMERGWRWIDGVYVWVWKQACKHGRKGTPQPDAVLVTADGPVPT